MASVGMVRLMRMYDDFFTSVSQPIAQVLVSLDNLMDRPVPQCAATLSS